METREKFNYYIIPEDRNEELQRGVITEASLEPYRISLKELEERLGANSSEFNCSPSGQSTIQCNCGGNPPIIRYSQCTTYRNAEGEICYTMCQPCHEVCK